MTAVQTTMPSFGGHTSQPPAKRCVDGGERQLVEITAQGLALCRVNCNALSDTAVGGG